MDDTNETTIRAETDNPRPGTRVFDIDRDRHGAIVSLSDDVIIVQWDGDEDEDETEYRPSVRYTDFYCETGAS